VIESTAEAVATSAGPAPQAVVGPLTGASAPAAGASATAEQLAHRHDLASGSPIWGALARHPQASALLGAFCIAWSGILVREAAVSPTTAATFRAGYAVPFLFLVAFLEARWSRVAPRPWRQRAWALLGGAFFGIDLVLFHHGIEYIGAGLATVMGNVQVIFVAVIAWLVWHERPNLGQAIGIPVALVGVVLISGVVGGSAYGSNPQLGVILGLGCAAAYAGYLLLIRKGRDRSRVAGPIMDAAIACCLTAAVIGLVGGDLNLMPSWPAHGWLLVLALSAQFAGGLLIAVALPRLPAVHTSLLLLTQPVIAVALAMIIVAETPSAFQLLGVALVLLGVAVGTEPLRQLVGRGTSSSTAEKPLATAAD
jgi:drug/metabolite transporter (DMT)-like permease